jgi:hypothetical protein
MTGQKNGPRQTNQEPSKKHNQTASKGTRNFDPDHCDASCGSCWETYVGDQRWCEIQHLGALRRDLAEALGVTGGGDRG